MSTIEKKKVEKEFLNFTARHFEKPSKCRNKDQIRFYIHELTVKIEDFNKRFNYVPSRAYSLLSAYNASQNSILYKDFVRTYSRRND